MATEKGAKHLASVVPGESSQERDWFSKIKPQIAIPVLLKHFKCIKDSNQQFYPAPEFYSYRGKRLNQIFCLKSEGYSRNI